jgi:hypothetical protein
MFNIRKWFYGDALVVFPVLLTNLAITNQGNKPHTFVGQIQFVHEQTQLNYHKSTINPEILMSMNPKKISNDGCFPHVSWWNQPFTAVRM